MLWVNDNQFELQLRTCILQASTKSGTKLVVIDSLEVKKKEQFIFHNVLDFFLYNLVSESSESQVSFCSMFV